MSLRKGLLTAAGLAVVATPSGAAPIEFSATARANAGYASNPFLLPGENGGSISIGGSFSPQLTSRTATSVTTLTGDFDRTEYLRNYEHSDNLGVNLNRQQQFSSALSGNAHVGYSTSRGGFDTPEDILDQTTLGARRRLVMGDGGLTWQASARDVVALRVFGSHASYAGRGLSSYDQYGVTGSYSRVLSERTRVGASLSASRTESGISGDTDTVQPNLTLRQQLGPFWSLDGSVGLIFQRTSQLGFRSSSKSVGFDADLCGTYPRWTLCFTASRQTSPSGLGGLRTETYGRVSYDYRLDERSRFNLGASYSTSSAKDRIVPFPREKYVSADAGYSRDLSRRISVGASGSYRRRELRGFGTADGFTGTLNLIAKIGRLS